MQNRSLIEFELFHPSEIPPWSNADGDDPHLTGYQLSQGYICFNVGDQKLLEYSPEIVAYWKEVPTLVDQMIGRVYIDLIDELNLFLEPIPDDLLWWMMPQRESPGFRWSTLGADVWNVSTVVDCSLLMDKIAEGFSGHTLLLDRLEHSPDIRIWASETEVFIGWDNRDKFSNGVPVWTASCGVRTFKRDKFLAEMRDFRDRYFDAMARQLALVRAGALNSHIRTNVEFDERNLLADKAKPVSMYVEARTRYDPINWDGVRTAIQKTLEYTEVKLT